MCRENGSGRLSSELSSFCTRIIFTRTSIVDRTFIAHSLVISSFRTYINTYASRVPRRRPKQQGAPRHVACCEVRTYCRFRLRSTPFCSTPVSRMPLACWQPRVSKALDRDPTLETAAIHDTAYRLQECRSRRSVQTSHVGTARKSRCRSSASMAMAAIEAGDRQEMVPDA